MDRSFHYEIRVQGHLPERWSGWFEGLEIHLEADSEMVLTGRIADQAALFGILMKIRDLGLPRISVNRMGEKTT